MLLAWRGVRHGARKFIDRKAWQKEPLVRLFVTVSRQRGFRQFVVARLAITLLDDAAAEVARQVLAYTARTSAVPFACRLVFSLAAEVVSKVTASAA